MIQSISSQNDSIKKVTYAGMVINIALAVLKIVFGLIVHSMSLLADGFHSFSDLATDIAVLIGIRLGSKEPDTEHPYGHGRLETFAAAFIAVVLIVLGGGMIYKASMDIARAGQVESHTTGFGVVVMIISLISVVAKEVIYQWTRKIAVATHCAALYANAWHHRSDALSSVAVLIGAGAVLVGYKFGDQVATIVVGLMIIMAGVKVLSGCVDELTERAVDRKTVEHIEQIIQSEERIRSWHRLRTRSLGREIFIDLHILVDPELNITEAHEVSDSLENLLHEKMPQPVNVMVHIEPDLPELRK